MKKALILLLLVGCLFSCKHSKYNREAIELNDSAAIIQRNQGAPYEKHSLNDAIILYDKAIAIDSTYFMAYLNKFNLQNQLKQYEDAIATGKKLIKMRPQDGTIKMLLGETYERKGDTISSKKFYKKALLDFDNDLKSSAANSKEYESIQFVKAQDLVLLNEKQSSDKILQQLADNKSSFGNRLLYLEDKDKTREEIIYGATSMKEVIDGVEITTKTINNGTKIVTKRKL